MANLLCVGMAGSAFGQFGSEVARFCLVIPFWAFLGVVEREFLPQRREDRKGPPPLAGQAQRRV